VGIFIISSKCNLFSSWHSWTIGDLALNSKHPPRFHILDDILKKLSRSFNFTFRYIDDVLSLNNSKFWWFCWSHQPHWAWNKDATDTDRSASYLDLHLEIDSEGRLRTKLYDKRNDFNFPLKTFHLYEATFQKHLHMEYISLRWYEILELVVPIRISLIEGCC
jgi:hypothetical protein